MENFASQLRQMFRRFRRAPTFTLIAVITVAIGVGANTAVFSLLDGVLLKPLPYPHPEQLVAVAHTAPSIGFPELPLSVSNYFIYREQSRYFQDVGIYRNESVTVTGMGQPEQANAMDVTEGVLPILDVPPILGRWFSPTDDSPGAPPTAILMYSYWRSKFGGDRSILDRAIITDGRLRRIVGVMPQEFQFVGHENVQLLQPLQLNRSTVYIGGFNYWGVARLKPGATVAEANADVGRMLPIVLRSFPPFPGLSLAIFQKVGIGPNVRPLKQDVVGDTGKTLWILMGSIALVLLISCANVANLLLVRAEGRQQEFAIRSALGASRSRIAADLLLESLLIGLSGGAVGLGLAYGALHLIVALAPPGIPRVNEVGANLPVLAFALIVSSVVSFLFGAIPAFKYSSSRSGIRLRGGTRTLSQSRERHRARNALVIVQVALASILLICSVLMIRTFRATVSVQPGFLAPADVQTFRLSVPDSEVKDPAAVVNMQESIDRKIAAVPGVSAVALTSSVPMDDQNWRDAVFARDRKYADGELPPLRRFIYVSPGLFHTLGISLVAGRDFTWTDIHQKLPVAIVSENFAREYWRTPANALGKQIRSGSQDDWRQIIGVVTNVYDNGTNQKAPTSVYWPIFMDRFDGNAVEIRRTLSFVVRSPRAGSEALMRDLQQVVWSVDANLPLTSVETLNDFYMKSMARTSFALSMIGVAGGMALLLGMIGLYGVIAYSASQRTREIGIRIALGAQRNEVTRMFAWQGITLACAGLAVGLAIAAATTRLMSSLLFHVSPLDPLSFAAVPLILLLVSGLASYIPARRAAVVDPIKALRAE